VFLEEMSCRRYEEVIEGKIKGADRSDKKTRKKT
jgi:hypothetical protein